MVGRRIKSVTIAVVGIKPNWGLHSGQMGRRVTLTRERAPLNSVPSKAFHKDMLCRL